MGSLNPVIVFSSYCLGARLDVRDGVFFQLEKCAIDQGFLDIRHVDYEDYGSLERT